MSMVLLELEYVRLLIVRMMLVLIPLVSISIDCEQDQWRTYQGGLDELKR